MAMTSMLFLLATCVCAIEPGRLAATMEDLSSLSRNVEALGEIFKRAAHDLPSEADSL
eukprot:CAMPEP_0170312832 /NCGR_PEP_ID=MMETSP0116_2-20130129/56958_1 /TAXON_ID=400756 /ORGANISM="Durinskia baltica, Strain CSIRO CS-38" /LENGTH=57 /DNA_ID=CAMNT_0010565219 /DNA_START=27 /DNA_END=196 /DNA_ORIENTATION=+